MAGTFRCLLPYGSRVRRAIIRRCEDRGAGGLGLIEQIAPNGKPGLYIESTLGPATERPDRKAQTKPNLAKP